MPHVLRGMFRLEQRLGAGGMGVVYRAVDLQPRARRRDQDAAADGRRAGPARLRKEARAMAMVAHPNLAVIYGIETWRDMPFLVEEYLAGGTLAHGCRCARPSLAEALQLGITLADALEHLHAAGILHCDIKPSNIGFTQHGVVKLLDFGLARLLRDARAAGRRDHQRRSRVETPPLVAVERQRRVRRHAALHVARGGAGRASPRRHSMSGGCRSCCSRPSPDAGRSTAPPDPEIFSRVMAPRRPDLTRVLAGVPGGGRRRSSTGCLALDPGERPRDPGIAQAAAAGIAPVAQLI